MEAVSEADLEHEACDGVKGAGRRGGGGGERESQLHEEHGVWRQTPSHSLS